MNKHRNRTSALNATYISTFDTTEGGYEPTPDDQLLHWKHFNPNFYSHEPNSDEVMDICDYYSNHQIDLRPYMWEHPFIVYPHDDLDKCLELFRHHHLRHLPVVNPSDGKVVGIITRKDIFEYMHL